MRGLGALPESAEATECPGRLLGQLGFGMGLEGDGALLDLGGGGIHTEKAPAAVGLGRAAGRERCQVAPGAQPGAEGQGVEI